MTDKTKRNIQLDLGRLIQGSVLDARDRGYQKTVSIDNGRVELAPMLVALAETAKDIGQVVKYCGEQDIPLTIKSGGHSAAGYCLNGSGIVLDLSLMNSITPTSKSNVFSIGTGSTWINVYNYLKTHESPFTAVGGGCPSVALGGFLLGGGYSFISRSFGLGSDNVRGLEFVTTDGSIININENTTNQEEKDLLWALRGGGGGNFGITSQVDLEVQRTNTNRLLVGQIYFPFYQIREILHFYNEWVLTLPNEMAVYGMLKEVPDPINNNQPVLSIMFTPIYNGNFAEGMKLLQPLMKLIPKGLQLNSMTLPEFEIYSGGITVVKGRSAYIRSVMMPPGGMNSDVIDLFMKYMARAPSNESFVVWTHTGGRIRENSDVLSCYPHRNAEFLVEVKSIWESASPELMRENVEWAVNFFDELEPYSTGAYLNYIDPLLINWQDQYYKSTYHKLVDLKKRWDPKGQFDFQQGIGSKFQPDRSSPLDLSPLFKTL